MSSTDDLLEWGEILYGDQFLGATLDAELHTLHHDDHDYGADRRYGLGVTGWCPCDTLALLAEIQS